MSYRLLVYICVLITGLSVQSRPALAGSPDSGVELGVFEFDARSAHGFVRPSVVDRDDREICSVADLHIVDQAYAEMFNLRHEETCSDSLVLLPSPEEPEGVCKYEGMDDLGTDYLADGGDSDDAVLISLDLTSYRMNPRAELAVKQNIMAYTGRIKKRFSIYLGRSSRYIRMMKGILRDEGVPDDMVYLALIESGFNTHAYSRSRASGPWQFMKHTGSRYGLRVDKWVDERRDPIKSTRAAARYLTYLHNMFDSWSLAMAAYNAGEGRIRGALRKSGATDYWSLMGTRHIKPETKNYVPKFIATRLIAISPEKYGFEDIEYHDDFVFDEVELRKPMGLALAARCAGTTEKEIKELNPELRLDRTPPVSAYRLRVPRGSREIFLANAIEAAGRDSVAAKTYTVVSGESIESISLKTGVSRDNILSLNRLHHLGSLEEGQTLLLPLSN